MPIINQDFEKSLQKKFRKIKSNHSSNKFILFGSVKTILPMIKAFANDSKNIPIDMQTTIYAFEKLQPTDLVAYSKDYQIGFPVGMGALKYYSAINDSDNINVTADSIMDLPDGAERKLNLILHDKDPFKHAPSEIINKLTHHLL